MDPYYSLPDVSNSDLSWLKQQLQPRDMPDPTNAYRFGSLIDAMITEPLRVNYFNRTLDDDQFPVEEFKLAEDMKRAFWNDDFCRLIASGADGQKVMRTREAFDYNGFEFHLCVRCKWDLWHESWGWGGDIKSTACETQKQFEEAARYFDYDRQRAWYMMIANSRRDVLLGISKKNLKIFRINITRDSSFFKDGFAKYNELAFKHYLMFGEYKANA
ncbi:MAG: PD-(D/E)XK nuclease-like domain-containing protein [Prevotella sp.]|jgi:hypothetical protein|nr:PD-(D/E)XK nuclease-like domain-containing protein [Prevotella sp.]